MENDEEEFESITLTFEDGTESECLVWGYVELDGQKYISLLPMDIDDNEDDEEGGCYLYQYDEDNNGDPVLGYIDDDDLLNRVIKAFDDLYDEEENGYDEYISEDDL